MKPRSDAHALHTLLCELTGGGDLNLHTRWAEVLECEYQTIEYARRYVEVVGLLESTLAQIAVMPERSRERYERHAFTWWRAVIAPQHNWGQKMPPGSVIDQASLDQLDSAAELIEARMDGSLAVPNSDDLEPLREECKGWIDALNSEGSLPQTLRMNLLQDLEHIVWLVDHADLFGVARVTAASQAVVGSMAVVAARVDPPRRTAWVERSRKFIRALVALSALLQGIDVGMELGTGAMDVMGELTERLTEE